MTSATIGSGKTVGIGIIGCGTIAERMMAAWQPRMEGARLVSVMDVSPARLDVFKQKFGAPHVTTELDELLARPEVDAVLVLTPNFLHAPNSIAAAKARKHVLCQKPMAMSLDEARQMIDAAKENGVILMSSFMKRFWPYYVKLKSLLDEGVLGKLIAVRSQFSHSGIGKYYKPASQWFLDPAKSGGGPLVDLGVHHFDVLRWLVGAEVVSVSADTASLGQGKDVEDNALVNLRFANGVVGHGYYSFTTIAPPGVTIERIEVYGSQGTAIATLQHPARCTVQLCAESGPAAPFGGWIDLPITEPVPAFALMLQNFADSVASGSTPRTTGEDGYRSLEICLAAYASAREGRRIDLGTTIPR
jgi:predicted dehydrogenase